MEACVEDGASLPEHRILKQFGQRGLMLFQGLPQKAPRCIGQSFDARCPLVFKSRVWRTLSLGQCVSQLRVLTIPPGGDIGRQRSNE